MSFSYPPGAMPLPPYRIRRGIGVGGFGEVYFAVSEAGKEVALKRVQRNLDVELRGVSHCLNLKHAHLVALFDICRDAEDQAWVVMEYVAGPNLREVLDEAPNGLPEAEVQRWFQGITAGVRHLHAAGLVHRDLKPGNVFDDLGTVKVGDYGLSKFISTSHRGGHTESVGTFHYMAPEIGRGQYGREIDIYALGIVLFELLTGNVPFDGESCHEIIVKHLTATPDLSALKEPYRSTVAKCLEKDPAKRPSTVDELLSMLRLNSTGNAIRLPSQSFSLEPPVVARLANNASPTPLTGPSPARAATTAATTDEPLARAVRNSYNDLQRWWVALDRSPGAKAFLTIVAVLVLLLNTHWLVPALSMLGVFYVPYYVVRHMVLHVREQPTYAQAQKVASVNGTRSRAVSRQQWRDLMRSDLRAKHSVVRMAELSTSYIATTFTTVVLAMVAGVIGLRTGEVTSVDVAPYFWMASVVLASAYALLGLGKIWERGEGESLKRRIALAGVGAGIGLFAFSVMEFLMLPIDQDIIRNIDSTSLPQALYNQETGVPRASAWMAHFAVLFAVVRWWKPVDPLRRSRLGLWSVAVAVVAEWAVQQFLPIPQPSGMLIAGGLAIAIQLSAPWINSTPQSSAGPMRQPGMSPNQAPQGRVS
jgi:serine/threonine protein kinase